MDHRLVAWGRQVKARRGGSGLPPLWLFTDPARMDVLAAVAALPAGLCGVVFRHDGVAGRGALLAAVARLCRARRLRLVVAGDGALPPGAGRHLREGRGRRAPFMTSSAHGRAGIVRARRAGAAAVFLSPVFPTLSHPSATSLGPLRWGLTVRDARIAVGALGGISGRSAQQLPDFALFSGAIGALLPDPL